MGSCERAGLGIKVISSKACLHLLCHEPWPSFKLYLVGCWIRHAGIASLDALASLRPLP